MSSPKRSASLRQMPFKGKRWLWWGLPVLILMVIGIAAWNQSRQPEASFVLRSQDLAPDPLAPLHSEPQPDAQLSQPSLAPAVTPEPSPAVQAVQIKGKDVNIRSQPSRSAAILARSQAGMSYNLSGRQQQAEGLSWVELQLPDGQLAWVSAAFVEQLAAKPAAVKSSAPAQNPQPQDEVTQAAAVVAQLLKAPGKIWPQTDQSLRQLTVQALLRQIFKSDPSQIKPEHALALDQCLAKSSQAKDLKALKVYELAVACALAFEWR